MRRKYLRLINLSCILLSGLECRKGVRIVAAFSSTRRYLFHHSQSALFSSNYFDSPAFVSASTRSPDVESKIETFTQEPPVTVTAHPIPANRDSRFSQTHINSLKTEEEFNQFLEAHPDKLIIVKFYATYCRACKQLAPKFVNVQKDEKLAGLPIVWAEFPANKETKNLFRQLGVLTLPNVHFYHGSRGLVENFPCPPTKIALLKRKLARFVNENVDPTTRQLKTTVDYSTSSEVPRTERSLLHNNDFVTGEHIVYLRSGLPFFRDLTTEEFETMLQKAKLQTFYPNDVIMRQGMPPTTFYVIKSGVVEMSIKSRFDDPISTPPSYLGAVVNQLYAFDYFGERALTTGEPYAASVRVLEKTRCFAFNVEDIPESSILSRTRKATQDFISSVSQRYTLPEDYEAAYPATPKDETILELLVRFKQIRQAAKCFNYIMTTEPSLGDSGEIRRRFLLVSKLPRSQQTEFKQVFKMADVNQNGKISLLEMRKFMESARESKTDEELQQMIERSHPRLNGRAEQAITLDEFMGVMAEAEFYSLFTDTFQALDKDASGFVRAGDLDEVLHGVRDLISDDRKSIIDVEDKDMLVDYEQFSKMLLGAAL